MRVVHSACRAEKYALYRDTFCGSHIFRAYDNGRNRQSVGVDRRFDFVAVFIAFFVYLIVLSKRIKTLYRICRIVILARRRKRARSLKRSGS